jgi:glycosyltransferase involved in cell wall biosynthesis
MVAVEAQAAGLHVLASDAVPREAEVVSGLMTFLPIAAGSVAWAAKLAELMRLPRFETAIAAKAVSASPFSIEQSLGSLLAIYNSAELPQLDRAT